MDYGGCDKYYLSETGGCDIFTNNIPLKKVEGEHINLLKWWRLKSVATIDSYIWSIHNGYGER